MNFQPYAISQSQMIGTFVPEQILRGKVIDILPDRTALLQLGTKQVVAKVGVISPPLKLGQDYLFQIQQNGNPILARVITHDRTAQNSRPDMSMVDDVLSAFNLKDEPLNRKLVQEFLDHGDPLTRDSVLAARALIGRRTDLSAAIQSVRWLMNRKLPMTPELFQLAENMVKAKPFTAQLTALQQELSKTSTATPSMEALKSAIMRFSEAKGDPPLSLIAGLAGKGKSEPLLKSFINQMDPQIPVSDISLQKFVSSSMSAEDVSVMLRSLHSSVKPEAFIRDFTAFMLSRLDSQAQGELLSGSRPGLLLNTLRMIGFDFEKKLRIQMENGDTMQKTDSFKENLLAVAGDSRAPYAVRKMAHELVQRITGEQLQMASSDPEVAQFSLQLPIPFHQEMKNVTVYFEGKRNRKGMIDPNSCTIVLCLDLTHMKQTVVSIRVQNRSVSLAVQNASEGLDRWLKEEEPMLREHLEALNYHLASVVRTERLNPHLVKKAMQPLTFSNYTVDVKI